MATNEEGLTQFFEIKKNNELLFWTILKVTK